MPHLHGLPLGTVGGMRARHTFPVDGEYEFQVRLYRTNLSAIRGLEDPHDLELTLDEEPILRASIGGEKDSPGLELLTAVPSHECSSHSNQVSIRIPFVERRLQPARVTPMAETSCRR